jgi:NAD(P)-dependent dehydrogenase (short-subunit alcohol dehydrogenase family)
VVLVTGPTAGRVVLVTGGARGLGRGLVDAFADNGDQVLACGRKEPEPGALTVPFFPCDVRESDQVATLVDEIMDRYGRLDVCVNNAGGAPYAPAATMSPRLFERVIALNLCGAFYVSQRANAVMQDQDSGGVIINIGSAIAIRPSPGSAPYAAAKAGLLGLTRSLAIEWAPKVRVNLVSPGLLRTELVAETYGDNLAAVEATVPMGRMAAAAEIGAVCVMLASPALAYVTGAELLVDGGGEHPAWRVAAQSTFNSEATFNEEAKGDES